MSSMSWRHLAIVYLVAVFGITVCLARRYSVLRIVAEQQDQLDFLIEQYVNSSQYDFWKEPTSLGEQVHVMLRDDQMENYVEQLEARRIKHTVMIEDVGKAIKNKEVENSRRARTEASKDRLKDAPDAASRVAFNAGRYHSFADTINYLNSLALAFPERVQVMPIGTTHEGRQIPMIKIGTRRAGAANKPGIWIDGGIHAREWISPAVVLYFIHQLVTKYDVDPEIRNFVDSVDWYVVPLLNPDGYEYSRSSSDVEIRLWRKNRSPAVCNQVSTGFLQPPTTQCCQGVDLNRNFDWYFGQVGSSTDPCSEIYNGQYAFSEPETRAVRDFVLAQNGKIKTFITFHSYSQILMYPFGHAVRTYANDIGELSATANKAAAALTSMYGTKYIVGTGADTLYPASGGSEDWAKGSGGVKYSYLFELRPEDNVWDGFLLAESQIVPTSRETWEAVKVITTQTIAQFAPPKPVVGVSPFSVGRFRSLGASAASTSVCRDLDQLCNYWAENGACRAWPSMRERCALSCGFCPGRMSL